MGPKKYIVVKDEIGNTIISTTNDLNGALYLYFAYKLSQLCLLENRIYNAVLFKYMFLKFDLLEKYGHNTQINDFYRSVEKMYHYHGLNNTIFYQESEKIISSCTFQYKNELEEEKDKEKKNPFKNKNLFKEPKTLTCFIKEPGKSFEDNPYYTCDISEDSLLDIYWLLEGKKNDARTNIILGNFTTKLISLLEMNGQINESKSLADHMKRVVLRKRDIDRGNISGYKEFENSIKCSLVYKIGIKKSVKNDPKLFIEYLLNSKETTFEHDFVNKVKELFEEIIKDEENKFSLYIIRLEILLYENGFYNILDALNMIKEAYSETVLRSVFIDAFEKKSKADKESDGNQRKHND